MRAPQLCIGADCRTAWPSGGGGIEKDTLATVVSRGNSTTGTIYANMIITPGLWVPGGVGAQVDGNFNLFGSGTIGANLYVGGTIRGATYGFGGIYGTNAFNGSCTNINPFTGGCSCPSGFIAYLVSSNAVRTQMCGK